MVGAQEFHQECRRKVPGIKEHVKLHHPPKQAYSYLQRPPGEAFVSGIDVQGSAAHGPVLAYAKGPVGVLLHPVAELRHILPGILFLAGSAVHFSKRSPPALPVELHPHLYVLDGPVLPVDVLSVIPDGIFQDVEGVPEGIIGPQEILVRCLPRFFSRDIYALTIAVILQKGLRRLFPLPFVTARLNLLQARSLQVQKGKDVLHVTCRSAGDKAENPQKQYYLLTNQYF